VATRVHVALSYLRVRHVTPGVHGVLIVARDISPEIHQQRVAKLFLALANEVADPHDGRSSIRSTVEQGRTALGADAASIFLTSPDGLRLHGALVGWDWTRTSFDAEIERWPNVHESIRANAASYLTAHTAVGAEREWFEYRGIRSAICAPIALEGRVLGVLFFDYVSATTPPMDIALAKAIADRCAIFIARLTAETAMDE
jgi:GAF domain-containing protein